MILATGLRRGWHWIVLKTLNLWVKVAVKPEDAACTLAALAHPVCYVLERESDIDLAVLNQACGRLGLPRPTRRLAVGGRRTRQAYFELARRARWFSRRRVVRIPHLLTEILAAADADGNFDVDLVPVAIFWGRAPHKEARWWRLLFTDNWALVGRFRKLLTVAVNGRNTLIHFGEPLPLRAALQAGWSESRNARRIMRIVRATLQAQRTSTIGPDLSHRRTIVVQVLKTETVRRAIRADMLARGATRRASLLTAKKYADEIAANYSQSFVSLLSLLLGWLWNRLYDGVELAHTDKLREIGDGAEIIYVPCHRSHMDYLLLSYVIYHQGFAIPHVAAGVNLNMPMIGRLLRKGGAFFMRRTFKGNALYAAVFTNYLGVMMGRGHSLEYFIEGGRSRTGRLLQPRTGMLAMTVRSHLYAPKRPIVFLPVYIGYERIVEGSTYIGELSGRPKQKESILGLLRTLPALRRRFGKVHVNFGRPVPLDAVLQRHYPAWNRAAPRGEPDAQSLGAVIHELAGAISTETNAAAAVTPINLVAMAVLATPRQALPETDFIRQLELYQALLHRAPYSPLVTVTADSGAQMIAYSESMRMLQRQPHPLGDILRMTAERAVLATYYRNNVLHLFAMPSLLACCFLSNESMRTEDIQRLVWRVYPYVRAELFLRWDETQVGAVAEELLDAFAGLRLLTGGRDQGHWRRPPPTSVEAVSLSLLAEATIQTIERYYLAIALLLQAGSGVITQESLEERCHLTAQRMSLLYGLNSPEFFDKSLFRNFIDLLRMRGVIQTSPAQTLEFAEPLLAVAADAQLVLSEQIRHSILQVTLVQ
jgi:glycerol-3-phosphate O-acyltransferase